jgi:hypothetical protein
MTGSKLIATVPVSQRNQETDFYCFGQMAIGMAEGYILGVMSKDDFTKQSSLKEAGDRDDNGEGYVLPVDYVTLDVVAGWQAGLEEWFFPLRYGSCRTKQRPVAAQ